MEILLGVFLVGLAGLGVYHLFDRYARAVRRGRAAAFDTTDAANQLRFVSNAVFSSKPVMNKSEYRVFRIIERFLQAQKSPCRIFAQTSLGEVIRSEDARAFRSVNSKRVDCLIVGPTGLPVAVVEYQGSGHFIDSKAAARDAVKKEALRRAGVPYIEILPQDSEDDIIGRVRAVL